jgi:hypothetical protein
VSPSHREERGAREEEAMTEMTIKSNDGTE